MPPHLDDPAHHYAVKAGRRLDNPFHRQPGHGQLIRQRLRRQVDIHIFLQPPVRNPHNLFPLNIYRNLLVFRIQGKIYYSSIQDSVVSIHVLRIPGVPAGFRGGPTTPFPKMQPRILCS